VDVELAASAEAAAICDTVPRVIGDLEALNRDTEADFLSIGGNLMRFHSEVAAISSDLAALAEMVSGEDADRASAALNDALQRSAGLTAQSTQRNIALESMQRDTSELSSVLAGLQSTGATFRTLGLLTRIEIARLGSAGADFGNLTDEVKGLAGDVQNRVSSVVQITAGLIASIECALRQIAEIESGQALALPSLLDEALARLAALKELRSRSLELSLRLRERFTSIADSFNTLLMSIQAHDITRQQVEHVIEALRNSSDSDERLHAVLALQTRQLETAASQFRDAVASIQQSLESIASNVSEASGESRRLFTQGGDEGHSFFCDLERGGQAILKGLKQCGSAEEAARATMETLNETFGRIREPVKAIRLIENQMRHLAMNARIRALRLGEDGAALGTLADAMQQRAGEAGVRCHTLEGLLDRLLQNTGRQDEDSAVSAAPPEIEAALEELLSSGERSQAKVFSIVYRSEELSGDLVAARERFSVGEKFAEVVQQARAALDGIRKESNAGDCDLGDLTALYTMQSERDVHREFTGTVAPASNGSDFGDNVDLF